MDIRFLGVKKTWPGGACALDDVTLSVPAGEFCVVLGQSGAGKSTLLRCVNGLEQPDSGMVEMGGRRVEPAALPDLRRRIAMVHQDFRLVPRASVAANVMAGAAPLLPLWRIMAGLYPRPLQRKACHLLQQMGLEEAQLPRRAGQLSGGQQQRLGLVRALMLDSAVLLADEPVASLDPQASLQIMRHLRALAHERGLTVLCSLHQPDLARAFADRIVALHRGRVIFDGRPDALRPSDLSAIYPNDHAGTPPIRLFPRKLAG